MVMGVHVLVLLPCYKKYSTVDIYNKKICIIVALNCPYGGNIIPSLRILVEALIKKDKFSYHCLKYIKVYA